MASAMVQGTDVVHVVPHGENNEQLLVFLKDGTVLSMSTVGVLHRAWSLPNTDQVAEALKKGPPAVRRGRYSV